MSKRTETGWLGPATWVIPSSEDTSPLPLNPDFDFNQLTFQELKLALHLGFVRFENLPTIDPAKLKEARESELDFSHMQGLTARLKQSG